MIDAKELRVGNFVARYFDNEPRDEQSIDARMLLHIQDNYYGRISAHEIPLNEKWLEKFGFENYDLSWKKGPFELRPYLIADGYIDVGLLTKGFHPIIKSVHQLQNLYYALTGKEIY